MNDIRHLLLVTLHVVLAALMTSMPAIPAGLEADMVIFNGKILTVDSPEPNNFSIAQAAAIYDGKFVAVGTNEEVLQYAGPGTRKIDLGGRTVLPGLVETHSHIQDYGRRYLPPEQRPETDSPIVWNSKGEGLAQLRTMALKKRPGEWIATSARRGVGGTVGGSNTPSNGLDLPLALKKGEITRADLDAVTPDNPLRIANVFFSPTGDSLVNSKALEPLLARYPNLPGVHRDARGVPSGWLSGVADQLIEYEFMPVSSPQVLGPMLKIGLEQMAAQGITTNSTRLAPQQVAGYGWLNARGEMPIRLGFSIEASARTQNPDAIMSRMLGIQGGSQREMWGLGDNKLWLIGLSPISIDSVPNIGGSCVSKTYPREEPLFPLWLHQLYGPNGLCRLDDPNYRTAEELRAAAKHGFRISGMHTGGDRGIDMLLNIMDEMGKEYPDLAERRWSIDHCRFLTDEHARRAKKFNLVFSCGPKYVYSGAKGDIGAYSILYGSEIAADVVVPMKRLVDAGLRTTMELDQQSFYSFLAMEISVTRKDVNGKVWGPQQRINRRQALYLYTRWSAEYVLREKLLGSIEPKKLADFVVLDRDFMTIPEEEIGQIDPLLTVVGGEIAYTQPQFAQSLGLPVVGFQQDRSFWLRGTPEDLRRGGSED